MCINKTLNCVYNQNKSNLKKSPSDLNDSSKAVKRLLFRPKQNWKLWSVLEDACTI